jgi:hypothetical protein
MHEILHLPASESGIFKSFGYAKSVQLNSTSDFWVTQKRRKKGTARLERAYFLGPGRLELLHE